MLNYFRIRCVTNEAPQTQNDIVYICGVRIHKKMLKKVFNMQVIFSRNDPKF